MLIAFGFTACIVRGYAVNSVVCRYELYLCCVLVCATVFAVLLCWFVSLVVFIWCVVCFVV